MQFLLFSHSLNSPLAPLFQEQERQLKPERKRKQERGIQMTPGFRFLITTQALGHFDSQCCEPVWMIVGGFGLKPSLERQVV